MICSTGGEFKLLDGDKIAALVSVFSPPLFPFTLLPIQAAGFICERLRLMQADLTIGEISIFNTVDSRLVTETLGTFSQR